MHIGWTVLVLIVAAAIMRVVYRHQAFHRIEYTRRFRDQAVFAGETTEMIETIANRKLLPLPWVRAESRMDPSLVFAGQADHTVSHGMYHKSVFALMPYMRITRTHRLQAMKRGLYRVDTVTLTAGDPLMLGGETSRTFDLCCRLAVYPRLLRREELPFPHHSWLGDVSVRRWIMPDPFLRVGVRPYEPGDGMHLIHWKATARAGSLQVHRSDYTADPRLIIALNIDTDPGLRDPIPEPERIEYALSLAATVAHRAIRSGIPVGFLTNARCVDHEGEVLRFPSRCSREHLYRLYHCLASVLIARGVTFYTLLEQEIRSVPFGMDYLLLTAFADRRIAALAEALRALGNAVETVLLPPAENPEVRNAAYH